MRIIIRVMDGWQRAGKILPQPPRRRNQADDDDDDYERIKDLTGHELHGSYQSPVASCQTRTRIYWLVTDTC